MAQINYLPFAFFLLRTTSVGWSFTVTFTITFDISRLFLHVFLLYYIYASPTYCATKSVH